MSPSPFGDLLYQLIQSRGLTLHQFSELVEYPKQGISSIRNGRRPMPINRLAGWADVLELEGVEREIFLDHGALTHAPGRIKHLIYAIEEEQQCSLRSLLKEGPV